MSASTLYRCSGAALLVGGALAILGALLEIGADPGSATWIPGAWLSLAGMLLMVLGWPGLYVRQMQRVGRLGLLGFVLSWVSFVILGIGIGAVDAFVTPTLAADAATRPFIDRQTMPALLVFELVGGLLLVVGPFLFALVTIRAGVLPRAAAILLLAGAVATLVTVILHDWNEISAVILFLAIAWLGAALWANEAAAEARPAAPVLQEAHR